MPEHPVAANWESIPSEMVRHGVSRKAFGTDDVILVMNEVEPEIEVAPHKHEGRVLNMDVFAPARADYAHLLEWMKEGADPDQ